ncbi:hypothetical protein RRG08_018916 [Elysia crispata]|uniref:Uncharacterized protein n=1 Tax=Elysia crispata TaxID=231223 RepID=A0AAE0YLH4_9GAST|nr:hypothetical protein RRG08_018916 [Elysia crispata]
MIASSMSPGSINKSDTIDTMPPSEPRSRTNDCETISASVESVPLMSPCHIVSVQFILPSKDLRGKVTPERLKKTLNIYQRVNVTPAMYLLLKINIYTRVLVALAMYLLLKILKIVQHVHVTSAMYLFLKINIDTSMLLAPAMYLLLKINIDTRVLITSAKYLLLKTNIDTRVLVAPACIFC